MVRTNHDCDTKSFGPAQAGPPALHHADIMSQPASQHMLGNSRPIKFYLIETEIWNCFKPKLSLTNFTPRGGRFLAFWGTTENALVCLLADVHNKILDVWCCGCKQLLAPAQLRGIKICKCVVFFFFQDLLFFWHVWLYLVNDFFSLLLLQCFSVLDVAGFAFSTLLCPASTYWTNIVWQMQCHSCFLVRYSRAFYLFMGRFTCCSLYSFWWPYFVSFCFGSFLAFLALFFCAVFLF